MKQYRSISSEQSIASFMFGFEREEMTYDEYVEWSDYLEKSLTTGNIQTRVFYGEDALQELECLDGGYLFKFDDRSIKLASGKNFDNLNEEVFAYMDVDTLLAVLDAVGSYQKDGEGLEK